MFQKCWIEVYALLRDHPAENKVQHHPY